MGRLQPINFSHRIHRHQVDIGNSELELEWTQPKILDF